MKRLLPFLLLGLVACNNDANTSSSVDSTQAAPKDSGANANASVKPKAAKPAWGPDIAPEMQAVIEKLGSFNAPPLETLPPDSARKNPTPADAVKALMSEHQIIPRPMNLDTIGKEIPVKGGAIHARIYIPKNSKDTLPVIVYYHGGGWVIADIDTYDASAQAIAMLTNAIVVAVEYRKGPEHKFPTAHEDAFAAYEWTLKNANAWKGDAKRVGLLGESAGGNMAANVSIMARNKKIMLPLYQVLVYPVASDNMNSASYTKYADAKPLNKAMMAWFGKYYLPSAATMSDPRIALVKADLKGLEPTTIITAELDPLQSDGKALSEALDKAGVKTKYKMYDGVTHEFFGMGIIVPQAKDAESYAADDLKSALHK